ncbi:MAG: ADP-ribosyltransferase [Janthinobacterium lividum]
MPILDSLSKVFSSKKTRSRNGMAQPSDTVEESEDAIVQGLMDKFNAAAPANAGANAPLEDLQNAAYPAGGGAAAGAAATIGLFVDKGNGRPIARDRGNARSAIPQSPLLEILKKDARKVAGVMSRQQYEALDRYTSPQYQYTNAYLRENELFTSGWIRYKGQLMELSENQKENGRKDAEWIKDSTALWPMLPQGLILSRRFGLKIEEAMSLVNAKSHVLEELGFMSTSVNPDVYDNAVEENDLQKIQLRLLVGPDVKGLFLGSGSKSETESISSIAKEEEVLLPPSTRIQIMGSHRVTGPGYDAYGFGSQHPGDIIVVQARILPNTD